MFLYTLVVTKLGVKTLKRNTRNIHVHNVVAVMSLGIKDRQLMLSKDRAGLHIKDG